MNKKLMGISLFFILLITIITAILYIYINTNSSEDTTGQQIVALNETLQLTKQLQENNTPETMEELTSSITNLKASLQISSDEAQTNQLKSMLVLIYVLSILFILLVLGYVYLAILRPFDKMKSYASEIASGNLDLPLDYERSNYFGAFTWAFDHMRREIIKARSCEKEAIQSNKTIIATLSHDIKTPISSIRAYAEGLEANLDTDMEKRSRYTSIIMSKCDEVTKLTNDLFLHSLSDLDKLVMEFTEVDMADYVNELYSDEQETANSPHLCLPLPSRRLSIDKKRLEQALENLINNAKKYANTATELSAVVTDDFYELHVRDFGPGIPDEDLPFITEKFYRGHNAGDQEGSGLGLYIVNYIMKQHGGSLKLYNHADGLEVVLSFPLPSIP